jgi:hypothetical protein
LRAVAPAVVSFQGWALRRGRMTAAPPRSAIASWHLRVSWAPSAVTLAAVDQQFWRAVRAAIGDVDDQGLLRAAERGAKSGALQSSPISRSRLSTNPVVCRSAMPNSTFIVRQLWMAASL